MKNIATSPAAVPAHISPSPQAFTSSQPQYAHQFWFVSLEVSASAGAKFMNRKNRKNTFSVCLTSGLPCSSSFHVA